MTKLLEINNLTKRFDDFLLHDISFSLEPGFIMGFVGPNGSGKTTTINLILDAFKKNSGTIKVLGHDHKAPHLKKEIGVTFDMTCFVKDWNMHDVEKVYRLFYPKWDTKKYYNYLERFRIIPHTKVKDLSRGMSSKLMLATALSHDAKLLILDEPTSGLDPSSRDEIIQIFQEYIEYGTKSILFSTHIISDLERVADYITSIHNGNLLFTGAKDDFINSYHLVKGGTLTTPNDKQYLIGLRKFSTGFEALIATNDLNKLQSQVIVEQPTIEDIIVFTSRQKGGRRHVS